MGNMDHLLETIANGDKDALDVLKSPKKLNNKPR
jgi:hypothetical protein